MTETVLRRAVGVAALVGLGLSVYLTVVHYSGGVPVCTGTFNKGCATVQTSRYAVQFGIPVALIGAAGYVVLLGTAFVRGEVGAIVHLFAALVGVGYSIYLTWLEVGVIHAICEWCVTSAVIMTLILVAGVVRFWVVSGGDRPPGASP